DAGSVVVARQLHPCRPTRGGQVIVVERKIVSPDVPTVAGALHGGGDVMHDVVFDEVVRADGDLPSVTLRDVRLAVVKIAVAHDLSLCAAGTSGLAAFVGADIVGFADPHTSIVGVRVVELIQNHGHAHLHVGGCGERDLGRALSVSAGPIGQIARGIDVIIV